MIRKPHVTCYDDFCEIYCNLEHGKDGETFVVL